MTLPGIALIAFFSLAALVLLVAAIVSPICLVLNIRDRDWDEAGIMAFAMFFCWIIITLAVSGILTSTGIGPEWLHWPEEVSRNEQP